MPFRGFDAANVGMSYDLLGVGNALLDYQVEVPFEFLDKHQFKKGSMTLVDAETQHRLLQEIEKEFGANAITRTSGGCAANTLAGFASYGGSAFFVGKVGNDEQGDCYRKDLETCGVQSELESGTSDRTGTCLALITPDAERTMLTHLGIATSLSAADIQGSDIDKSSIVYIEGYLWYSPSAREASQKAMQIAREKKKRVAFTYSDSFCVEHHQADFIELAKSKIDILFCNEHEALKATHKEDIYEAFGLMRDWCEIVCITTGPKGALLSDSKKKIVEEIPTWDVKLVDKLGAGDLFASGVLFGLSQRKNLRESGLLGNFSATRVIQQMSARLKDNLSKHIEVALRGPEETPSGFQAIAI